MYILDRSARVSSDRHVAAVLTVVGFNKGPQHLCHTWMGLRQGWEVGMGRRNWRGVIAAAEVVLQQGVVC